jgi:hypothetical protein
MLYSFFWVIPQHPNFMCRYFGTHGLFRLHMSLKKKNKWGPSQAKPKFLLGAETSFCLLAIPAFGHIAGLSNRHLNSNWGMCLC